ARLTRLAGKLRHTAVVRGLEQFLLHAQEQLLGQVHQTFGVPWQDGWPRDRDMLVAVDRLLKLKDPERLVVAKLLRCRVGPPPWDLRDEPQNQGFLARLRERGVTVAPWLDGMPRSVQVDDGVDRYDLTLALCDDPLEVLHMGTHFQTCLGGKSSLFPAVIANATDINKRVLYGWRDDRVVGRCLFALTDDGHLLSFRAYCHDQIDFDAIVATYLTELATAMHTAVVSQGHVSLLLAPDWYDDGAAEATGSLAHLNDPSMLDLETIEASAFVPRLEELLDRPVDDIVLPLILALPGLSARPELVVGLAPALLRSTVPASRLRGAYLAFAAGQPSVAEQLLGELSTESVRDVRDWHSLATVAQLRPSWTLTWLRGRPLWAHFGYALESALTGVALEALHRPKQALEQYREALRFWPEREVSEAVQQRIGALDATTDSPR
ncbi:MAG: hypothetical protein HC863_02920, partial [Myxococcales bacterium]|nr:hypothetical protein [Myxococcales bacterium]